MNKKASEVIAEIRKLLFGSAAKFEEVTEETVEEVVEEKVEEIVEEKIEQIVEEKIDEKIEEAPANTETSTPDPNSMEAQLASIRKQMEVLSEFAMLKEQVDSLQRWVKQQLSINEGYKQAFKKLLPLVEEIAATPTGSAAQTPKQTVSAQYKAATQERASNFLANLRKAQQKK